MNHIVITTIFIPHVLADLLTNLNRFVHLDDTRVLIVADKKTDPAARSYCNDKRTQGLDVVYLDCDTQARFLSRLSTTPVIPWNSGTRKNFGILYALAEGTERIIILDDDNFPGHDDFIGGHSITGEESHTQLSGESGWFDELELLELDTNLPHPRARGFPYRDRDKMSADYQIIVRAGIVGINQGLWTGAGDLDAMTIIQGRCRVVGPKYVQPVVLAQNTWIPIDTQNTSFIPELAPAMWSVTPDANNYLKRWDDIIMGYNAQAVIAGTRYVVSVGRPIVDHRRNQHDPLLDLLYETTGVYMGEWLVPQLRELKWEEMSIGARMMGVADCLETLQPPPALAGWIKLWLADTAADLRRWVMACQEIQGA
jgi:hypothetical protein